MAVHWLQLIAVTVFAAATIFGVGYWIEGRTALLHSRRNHPTDPGPKNGADR